MLSLNFINFFISFTFAFSIQNMQREKKFLIEMKVKNLMNKLQVFSLIWRHVFVKEICSVFIISYINVIESLSMKNNYNLSPLHSVFWSTCYENKSIFLFWKTENPLKCHKFAHFTYHKNWYLEKVKARNEKKEEIKV